MTVENVVIGRAFTNEPVMAKGKKSFHVEERPTGVIGIVGSNPISGLFFSVICV